VEGSHAGSAGGLAAGVFLVRLGSLAHTVSGTGQSRPGEDAEAFWQREFFVRWIRSEKDTGDETAQDFGKIRRLPFEVPICASNWLSDHRWLSTANPMRGFGLADAPSGA